jgi:serine/threonine-protein kinase
MSSLKPEEWREISPYLDHALSLSETERQTWLQVVRVQRPDLSESLQQLLQQHQMLSQEKFLDHSPERPSLESSLAGHAVGPYTLLSLIGQGGMGGVWLAERNDGRFERKVAIKFPHIALQGSARKERFKREGSILARLVHPNISELLDAGVSAAEQPYLVLEYVDGEPIDRYCERQKLGVEEKIRLFLDVLSAVALAHANLVVHRDIKPSNVLVRSDGRVKLLDFGIAKLLQEHGGLDEANLLTQEGEQVLTPEFAAPEQLKGAPVTTATDVYSLGVLLYMLLAGRHPAGPGPHSAADLIKAIVETEAPRLSAVVCPSADSQTTGTLNDARAAKKLRRRLRGDLDTIVAKALKKSPGERYTSVTAFGDDLERYLKHQPIRARPDSARYRMAKFVRRNRKAVVLAALALAVTITGVISVVVQARIARKQREFAFRELARAEQINSLNKFLLSDAAPSGKPLTVNELLERAEHIVERENYADNASNHVKVLASIGLQFIDRNENEKALTLLEEAYKLSGEIRDPSARAQAACSLALSLDGAGQQSRADALVQQALRELPNDPQFTQDRVFCLLRGSEISIDGGLAQPAILQAQRAEILLQNSRFSSNALRLNLAMDLASAYNMAGQYRQALDRFSRAAALMTELGYDDTTTAATMFNDWGLTLMLAGRPEEAEKIYRRGIDIGRSAGAERVSPGLLNNYADALLKLRRTKEAATYAEQAYDKARKVKDQFVIEKSLMERSRIYFEEHDFARSSAMLDEVAPLLQRDLPPGHYAFARLASDRANLAQAQGNRGKALQLVNQAVGIVQAAIQDGKQGAFLLPVLLLQRSDFELSTHQNDAAAADAAQGLSLAQSAIQAGTYSQLVGSAHFALGRALAAQGQTDQARSAFRAAEEQFQNTLGPDDPDTRTARENGGR